MCWRLGLALSNLPCAGTELGSSKPWYGLYLVITLPCWEPPTSPSHIMASPPPSGSPWNDSWTRLLTYCSQEVIMSTTKAFSLWMLHFRTPSQTSKPSYPNPSILYCTPGFSVQHFAHSNVIHGKTCSYSENHCTSFPEEHPLPGCLLDTGHPGVEGDFLHLQLGFIISKINIYPNLDLLCCKFLIFRSLLTRTSFHRVYMH